MDNRRYIIMGASSGIGRELALRLLARGARVGVAARNVAKLEEIRVKYPDRVYVAEIDIDDEGAPSRLSQLIGRMGGMDTYIHVAGIGYDNPSLDPERDASIAATDAVGFARMVCAAFRYFADGGAAVRPQIVGVSSVAGTKGIGMMAAYSASKSFDSRYLLALSQLARMRGLHIDITDIRPGWTTTPLLHDGVRYPMQMSLDKLVRGMMRAIDRRPRVAVIDRSWRALVALWGLMPDWMWLRMPRRVLRMASPAK